LTRTGSAFSVLAAWPPAALLPASGPPAARTRSFGCGFGPRASRWRVAGPRAAGLRESGQRISGLRGGCPRTRVYLAHAGQGDRLDRLGGSKKKKIYQIFASFYAGRRSRRSPIGPARAKYTRGTVAGQTVSQTDRQTDTQTGTHTYKQAERQTHRQICSVMDIQSSRQTG